MKYNRWYSSIGKILVFLFFCLFAVAIILPLVWMLISSVKNNVDYQNKCQKYELNEEYV